MGGEDVETAACKLQKIRALATLQILLYRFILEIFDFILQILFYGFYFQILFFILQLLSLLSTSPVENTVHTFNDAIYLV